MVRSSGLMCAPRRRRSACARAASITTWRTSASRAAITRFSRCSATSGFGDYFKKDAIAYAWELLTSPDWFGIDKDRLYVTIFEGDAQTPRDDEAEQFWIEAGVPKERIYQLGAKDNFWQMGETGPCGPCSEIYYDLGPEASETGEDKPFGEDEQRYMEIWNLVFMQFDRHITPGGLPELTPLPKPSIDTGMGLERIACVLQGKLSNYQSDLFVPLIQSAIKLTSFFAKGTDQPGAPRLDSETWDLATEAAVSDAKGSASLRIIADHARAATFLIADGVNPANEGRGYVLRKILRRGIRHGRLLGQEQPFMHQMVYAVRDEMQVAYPELAEVADRVAKTVLQEEQQFARVLRDGNEKLMDRIIPLAQEQERYRLLAALGESLVALEEAGDGGTLEHADALKEFNEFRDIAGFQDFSHQAYAMFHQMRVALRAMLHFDFTRHMACL